MNRRFNKNLEVLMRFALDKKTVEGVISGTIDIEKALESVNKRLLRQHEIHESIAKSADKAFKASRQLFVGSTAFLGSMFLYSQKYVNELEKTDPLSRKWLASTKQIEESNKRIGQVVANEFLPIYQKAAAITRQVAEFVEANPEIVKAAINTGLFVAGFSALAMAVTKGIKFVADITYIATSATQLLAAKKMEEAANKQVAAAGGMNLKSGGEIAQDLRRAFGFGGTAAAGAGGVAATVATTLTVIAGGAAVGTIVYDILAKQFGLTRVNQIATGTAYKAGQFMGKVTGLDSDEVERKALVFAAIVGKLTGAIDESSPLWEKATSSIKKTNQALEEFAGGLAGSPFEKQIVDAYSKMKEEQKAAEEKYKQDVKAIIESYNSQILASEERNRKALAAIHANYVSAINSATSRYLKESKQAEESYKESRAKIIRDAGIEIQRIEQDLQDRLIKLRRDHEDKMWNLVAKRDAYGLMKQVQDYNRQRKEEIENANKEIARRRQDLAIRLNDMAESFSRERALRQEEYQNQLKEAAARRDEQLKAQREAYAEERKQLMMAKAEQLKQLAQSYQEESKRRREAFIAQVRDLDASLLGEQKKKQQYYALMLADAERFLAEYRRRLPSGASGGYAPIRDSGGYIGKGIFENKNGVPEYVLAGGTTKIAEALIGEKLTQGNILQYMIAGSKQINYHDNRRFDGRMSREDRDWVQNMIRSELWSIV